MNDVLLTAAQAARTLGVSRELIARHCRNGDIPAVQVGEKGATWIIRWPDLMAWAKQRKPQGRPPKEKSP